MWGGTVHSFIANSTYKQSPYLVPLYSTHCSDTKQAHNKLLTTRARDKMMRKGGMVCSNVPVIWSSMNQLLSAWHLLRLGVVR
jgi:hypothetical protein